MNKKCKPLFKSHNMQIEAESKKKDLYYIVIFIELDISSGNSTVQNSQNSS